MHACIGICMVGMYTVKLYTVYTVCRSNFCSVVLVYVHTSGLVLGYRFELLV